jgi:hypothetical protein
MSTDYGTKTDVFVPIYVYIYIYIYIYIYVCICGVSNLQICMYVCIWWMLTDFGTKTEVFVPLYLCVHIYTICLYLDKCVCMHVCVYNECQLTMVLRRKFLFQYLISITISVGPTKPTGTHLLAKDQFYKTFLESSITPLGPYSQNFLNPNKLECYITLRQKCLSMKNTLAYWAQS